VFSTRHTKLSAKIIFFYRKKQYQLMSQAFLKSIYVRAPKGRKFVQQRSANNSFKESERTYLVVTAEIKAYSQHWIWRIPSSFLILWWTGKIQCLFRWSYILLMFQCFYIFLVVIVYQMKDMEKKRFPSLLHILNIRWKSLLD